ncbi:MAG TPA: DUF1326 domain-containing protein [Thermoanaerobaculia bacterium]|nr:DUF1326 domain-containing protein [Thermoanaerobaculia bacterium]
MRRFGHYLLLGVLLILPRVAASEEAAKKAPPEWAMNATIIEACSCPMFCQCYFNAEPAGHHDHATGMTKHFCKGNLAYQVNHGHYGDTKLDGARFWIAGDLGETLTGPAEWIVVTFDPSVAPAQREAIGVILSHVYPSPAKDFKTGQDAVIEWKANKDRAVAMLDGGKAGEIVLKRFQGNSDDPIVIKNLKYIGAPRNDGFILMPNEIEAYHLGDKAFEYKGTNGFMITIDINSKDALAMAKPMG